jgi:pimeloyl-ACP methyl ester carboxylesterase
MTSLRNTSSAAAILIAALLAGPAIASAQATVMVDTVAPSTVRESSYAITSGKLSLPGTLTLPASVAGKIPVILIVAGSGPTDRNGNTIAPGYTGALPRPNTYAQLAWRLAEQGIASVRYDKRSLGENQARIVISRTSIDDFIGDVSAGAKQLSADARFSRVVLFGHSEGAELVLQAANRGAPATGIVMASGMGRRLLPLLHEQLSRQLPSEMLLAFDSAMAGFIRGETPQATGLPPALMSLLQPDNRLFMQGMQAYVPVEEIARAKFPILIVHGANDGQTSLESDARALAAAQPAAKLVVFPTANHVLKAATGPDLAQQHPLYFDPRTPIAPEITPAIAGWIKTLR